MKVRISIPGSYVTMELEEERAVAAFRELSGKLLGIQPAGKIQMKPRIRSLKEKLEVPEVANEPEPEAEAPVEAIEPEAADILVQEIESVPAKAYRGFLYIHCESCGRTRGFCAKEPLTAHKCSCGHETPLKDLVTMWVHCECGKRFKYLTNMGEFLFDVNCVNCGSPVPAKWNKGKKLYDTIKE